MAQLFFSRFWMACIYLVSTILLQGCLDKSNVNVDSSVVGSCVRMNQPLEGELYKANPLFSKQWHLTNNSTDVNSKAGIDYNVEKVWAAGVTGECVNVAVVDSGVQIAHEDLTENILPGYSYNYLLNSIDPTPVNVPEDETSILQASHGTNVAGVIAAVNNSKGGVGIAPKAKLMGFNILWGNTTDSAIANATVGQVGDNSERFSIIDVSNNSWGTGLPPGSIAGVFPINFSVWNAAIKKGVTDGREGKGIVYLFASGNDGEYNTDANNMGYTNNPFVLVVGGVDPRAEPIPYAQRGANVLVAGLTQGIDLNTGAAGKLAIVTTTLSSKGSSAVDASKNYTNQFNGTSAATPGVAGVVALMLQANPELSWRQVRWILAATARKVGTDPSYGLWIPSAIGGTYSQFFGYGLADAAAAVAMANNNPPQLGDLVSCQVEGISSQFNQQLTNTPMVVSFDTNSCHITTVEYVETEVSFQHSNYGDMEMTLSSPIGYKSLLAYEHQCYVPTVYGGYIPDPKYCNYYDPKDPTSTVSWTYGSVRHLGESLKANGGIWTLGVSDPSANNGANNYSRIKKASITVWGY